MAMYRILVIDDEASICEALAVGLSSCGYQVDVAASGVRGMMLASMNVYDVLVIDPCLSHMDGIEIIRKVKSGSPRVIPIVMTVRRSCESSGRLLQEGIAVCLEKPFEMKSLRSAVRDGLRERERKQ
jgi:DNA-binding response OmpR family regulator